MPAVFDRQRGNSPLILSVPHSGLQVPEELSRHFTQSATDLPDTDWHVDRLYDFAGELDATVVKANYSRYVVDLNRPANNEKLYPGQKGTGLFPEIMFDGNPIYQTDYRPQQSELDQRIEDYWRPYHQALLDEIARIKDRFGYAILWDCHSIAVEVPMLFEGELPTLNLGTVRGASCDPKLADLIKAGISQSDFSHVFDGRFIGGFITRHYGDPANDVHAVQMEIAQNSYLSDQPGYHYDSEKAAQVRMVLRDLLTRLLTWQS